MNRRLLIPLGAGIAVLVLWFVFLWGPQGSALSAARKRKNDATQQAATLRDQLNRLQQSRRDQPLKQSQLETLRVAIPDDPNLAQFILDANDAASRAGIDFLSITPTPPATQTQTTPTTPPTTAAGGSSPSTSAPATGTTPAAATPVPIKMAMSISGGYFQVLDFINRLNRLPRVVVIDGLTMNASAAGAATTLSVSLQARMFTTSSRAVSGGAATGSAGGGSPGASTTTTTEPGGSTTTTRTGGG